MKVLLIQPNRKFYKGSFDVYGCLEHSTLPLGLLYLASAIRDKHEVRILDCLMDEKTRIYRKGRTFYQGLEWGRIKKCIEGFQPDAIGLTIPFTAQERASDRLLHKIRSHFPEIKIILGGCAIGVNYEKYLKSGIYAIIGEGELSFPLLLEHFETGRPGLSEIPNLAYIEKGKIKRNQARLIENLDELKLPAYDLIDMERYLNRRQFLFRRLSLTEKARMPPFFSRNRSLRKQDGKRDIIMFTSRGCPFNCIFCSIHSQFGFKWRAHSAEYILRHIRLLAQKYGINHIHFEDDGFALDAKRLSAILRMLQKGGVQIEWDANLGLLSDSLDKGMLLRMRKAGCTKLTFALESGNDKIRNRVLGKKLDMQKIERLLGACKETGIGTAAFFMTGFPFETKEQAAETLSFAKRLEMRYGTEPMISVMQQPEH